MRTFHNKLYLLLFSLILFPQCENEESETDKINAADDCKISTYLANNNISATKHESGIYYVVETENPAGEKVDKEDIVFINYHISVLDGDSIGLSNDTIITFEQGTNSLIPYGLDVGCGLMHNGEQFKFFIPSLLAFGAYGNMEFDIDPYSILICDARVIKLQDNTEQFEIEKDSITNYIQRNEIDSVKEYASGLYFKKLTSASNGNYPESGDYVKIHFERSYLDGTVHYSTINNNPASFQIGSNQAVKGLEEGIKLLKEGEKALLILPSEIAFGSSFQVAPHVLRDELINDGLVPNYPTPFSPVIYKVMLLDIY